MVLLGKLTAINHLIKDYQLNKVMSEIFSKKKDDLDQLIIKQYPEAKLLNLNCNFKGFKALLI